MGNSIRDRMRDIVANWLMAHGYIELSCAGTPRTSIAYEAASDLVDDLCDELGVTPEMQDQTGDLSTILLGVFEMGWVATKMEDDE